MEHTNTQKVTTTQRVRDPWNQLLSIEVRAGGRRKVYYIPMVKTGMDGKIKWMKQKNKEE